jgi:pyruvate dehydrogenase E1 component alpha subunit
MGAHTTSDDPSRYRLAAELETWKLKDPIERVKAYLSRSGAGDAEFFARVDTAADEMAVHVRAGCLALADPDPLTLFDNVYAGGSSLLDEEREQMAAYLASFADAGR